MFFDQFSTGHNTKDLLEFQTSVHHGMLNMLIMRQQMLLSTAEQVIKEKEQEDGRGW